MDGLLEKFVNQKSIVNQEKKKLEEIEALIYTSIPSNEIPYEGTYKYESDTYELKMVTKMTVKVDEKTACLYPHLFKTKFDFSKTLYNSLNDSDKNIVDKIITKTPAKPSFSVEGINGDN